MLAGQHGAIACFETVPAGHPRASAIALAAAVAHSRVYERLRTVESAHGVRGTYHWRTGLVTVRCLGTADPSIALDVIDNCLEDLVTDPPTDGEHAAAVRSVLRTLQPLPSSHSDAPDFVRDSRTGMDAARGRLVEDVFTTSIGEVRDAAETYLRQSLGGRGLMGDSHVLTKAADRWRGQVHEMNVRNAAIRKQARR
jgi:Zn-dependent M16 (insulinase) family peptidase